MTSLEEPRPHANFKGGKKFQGHHALTNAKGINDHHKSKQMETTKHQWKLPKSPYHIKKRKTLILEETTGKHQKTSNIIGNDYEYSGGSEVSEVTESHPASTTEHNSAKAGGGITTKTTTKSSMSRLQNMNR